MTITQKQRRNLACHTRVHCKACRTDADWRERVTGVREFNCQWKITIVDGLPVEPLPQDATKITINPGPVQLTNSIRKPPGPGDRLHTLIVAKYGITPCSRCIELIERMNKLGPEGCRAIRDEIINDIWTRRADLKGWRGLAAKLPGAETAAKWELGRLFDQATS